MNVRVTLAEKAWWRAQADQEGVTLTDLIKRRMAVPGEPLVALAGCEPVRRGFDSRLAPENLGLYCVETGHLRLACPCPFCKEG